MTLNKINIICPRDQLQRTASLGHLTAQLPLLTVTGGAEKGDGGGGRDYLTLKVLNKVRQPEDVGAPPMSA